MATIYETMIITSTKLDEEASAKLIGKFKSLIEKNGAIESVEEWGTRKLAYPIQDETEGVYTLINFTCDTEFIAELKRVYGITDGILRNIIVVKAPVSTKSKAKSKAKATEAE